MKRLLLLLSLGVIIAAAAAVYVRSELDAPGSAEMTTVEIVHNRACVE